MLCFARFRIICTIKELEKWYQIAQGTAYVYAICTTRSEVIYLEVQNQLFADALRGDLQLFTMKTSVLESLLNKFEDLISESLLKRDSSTGIFL